MVEQDKDISSNNYLTNKCYSIFAPTLPLIPPKQSTITAKFDSGATKHYFTRNDAHILQNQQELHMGPKVKLPNDVEIQATSRGLVPLHTSLSPSAS